MIDLDKVMGKFMWLSIIGGIIGFVIFGTAIAPLMPIWLLGGALLIVISVWIINDVNAKKQTQAAHARFDRRNVEKEEMKE